MILVDANLLVYARVEDFPQHRAAHAWLDQQEHRHTLSAVTLSPVTCLEINPSALALASEEVREQFRQQISSLLVRRMTELSRAVAQHNGPARRGEYRAGGGLDLQLVDG